MRHPVNVAVADGTYAAGLGMYDFRFDPINPTNGAFIQFTGNLANATVATGTATGTATAGSAGSGSTFGTLTDGAQTWTVNDLKGKMINITGGTGSGQVRQISSNTATDITVVGTWTAPTGTSTYAVSTWGNTVTGSINQTALPNGVAASLPSGLIVNGIQLMRYSNASSPITFKRINFSPSGVNTSAVFLQDGAVGLIECKLSGNAAASGILTGVNALPYLDTDLVTSATGAALSISAPSSANALPFVGRSIIQTTGAAGNAMTVTGGYFSTAGAPDEINALNSATTNVLSLQGGLTKVTLSNLHLNCTAGGSTTGLSIATTANSNGGTFIGVGATGVQVLACPIGVSITGPSTLTLVSGNTFQGATTGFLLTRGGRIDVTADPTFTTYGTELSIDGVTSTYAAFLALTPPSISNLGYGSAIYK